MLSYVMCSHARRSSMFVLNDPRFVFGILWKAIYSYDVRNVADMCRSETTQKNHEQQQ